MKKEITLSIAIIALFFSSCKPRPIDIKIDQKNQQLAIASVAVNDHTVLISAGYTINSLSNLLDTTNGKTPVEAANNLLVDSGLVIITSAHQPADTLKKLSSGLYKSNKTQLLPDVDYTLYVKDLKTGKYSIATTKFYTEYKADTLMPIVERRAKDTIVRLHACIGNVKPTDRFFIHYTSSSAQKSGVNPWSMSASVLQTFSPKRIELLSGADAVNGRLLKEIVLAVKGTDTLLLQFSKVEEPYYNYLSAYKRSGNLISQLTGEPVNLPSNLTNAVGFFSLYLPQRQVYDLKKY